MAASFRAKSIPNVPPSAITCGNMAHPETRFKIEISRSQTQISAQERPASNCDLISNYRGAKRRLRDNESLSKAIYSRTV
jgi:hypothetical protein